ncbi:MAG TPA: ATPase, T2SS/T4P/T4SS family [Candidatus Ozemobacteraceae bacterium]|nr:ATPase, T2SS/T4P/T4SS family [Candidatus Ozemobacteraceae bacterium]
MKMKRIGDALIDAGVITNAQLQEALAYVKKRGIRLGEALIEMGLIGENDLMHCLSEQLGIPSIPDEDLVVDPSVIHEVPYVMAKKHNLIPLGVQNGRLVVATFDPLNINIIDDIESRARRPVTLVLASSRRIAEAIEQYYSGAENIAQTLKQVQDMEDENILARLDDEALSVQDTPVVKFVNQILQKAVKENASDVHIEVDHIDFHIRFRIDGLLQTMFRPKMHLHSLIVSRLKVMSRMDVSEHRLPQDGRIMLKVENELVDFRTSTIPCMHGENMVVRILNRGPQFRKLSELGFSDEGLKRLDGLVARSHGLVLVAGQTGSGKTTTLYSVLKLLNDEKVKIITLEDPVEMQLAMLNQIQVNPKIDLTFANGLRSILRMDPDIIMIGEIRDRETAQLSINAAMTGHLVFSTIHTGTAAEVPVRLREMGVEPYLIANTLVGSIAQRLVRLNCPNCLEEEQLPGRILGRFKPDFKSFHGKGCPSCNRIGYRGRTCIEEVMPTDTILRQKMLAGASTEELEDAAVKAGMRTLFATGVDKVKAKLTSFEELARVM